jgi:hypothetical protein
MCVEHAEKQRNGRVHHVIGVDLRSSAAHHGLWFSPAKQNRAAAERRSKLIDKHYGEARFAVFGLYFYVAHPHRGGRQEVLLGGAVHRHRGASHAFLEYLDEEVA